MRLVRWLTLAVVLTTFWLCEQNSAAGLLLSSVEDKDEIPDKIGPVKIVTTVNDEFYPRSWTNDAKIKPIAQPAEQEQIKRIIPLIRTFVKDYPEDLLKENLKGVYVCKKLQFYGKDFGGTNSTDRVYSCIRTDAEGYTSKYLLCSLHHEFSSILMRNYPFPKKEWASLNPKDFKYTDNAVGDLDKEELLVLKPKFHEIGFMCLYSQSSMEEDFNTIAENLFEQRDELYKIASNHPKLKAKVVLALKFYKAVDARFSFGKLEEFIK